MELVFLCVTAVVCIVLVALVAIKDKAAWRCVMSWRRRGLKMRD